MRLRSSISFSEHVIMNSNLKFQLGSNLNFTLLWIRIKLVILLCWSFPWFLFSAFIKVLKGFMIIVKTLVIWNQHEVDSCGSCFNCISADVQLKVQQSLLKIKCWSFKTAVNASNFNRAKGRKHSLLNVKLVFIRKVSNI